jgi:hypothetical protein
MVFPKLIKEATIDLSNIYPSRVGTVSTVEKKNDGWHIYDNDIPPNLDFDEYKIDTVNIIFQTGLLAGKEFKTTYNHSLREFWIEEATHDELQYPNDYFYPKVHDKYIVIGINMPMSYICDYGNKKGASFDMLNEAIRYFHENNADKVEVPFEIDPVWFRTHYEDIKQKITVGGFINIQDSFIHAEMPIRIKSIRMPLTNRFSPKLECFTNNKKTGLSFYINNESRILHGEVKENNNNAKDRTTTVINRIKNIENVIYEIENSNFEKNPITDGVVDEENCRFFVQRDMDRNKTFVLLNGVKLKKGLDYFHRPDPKELVFSYAPFYGASLEIYSN